MALIIADLSHNPKGAIMTNEEKKALLIETLKNRDTPDLRTIRSTAYANGCFEYAIAAIECAPAEDFDFSTPVALSYSLAPLPNADESIFLTPAQQKKKAGWYCRFNGSVMYFDSTTTLLCRARLTALYIIENAATRKGLFESQQS